MLSTYGGYYASHDQKQDNDYNQVMLVEKEGANPEELKMVDKAEFREKHITSPEAWHLIRAKYTRAVFGAIETGNKYLAYGRMSHRKHVSQLTATFNFDVRVC